MSFLTDLDVVLCIILSFTSITGSLSKWMHNYKFGLFKQHDFHKDNKIRPWDEEKWHKDGFNTDRDTANFSNSRRRYLKFRLGTCVAPPHPPKRAFFGTEILSCKLHFRILKSDRNCTITQQSLKYTTKNIDHEHYC